MAVNIGPGWTGPALPGSRAPPGPPGVQSRPAPPGGTCKAHGVPRARDPFAAAAPALAQPRCPNQPSGIASPPRTFVTLHLAQSPGDATFCGTQIICKASHPRKPAKGVAGPSVSLRLPLMGWSGTSDLEHYP